MLVCFTFLKQPTSRMTFSALAIDLDGTLLIGEDLPVGHRDAVAAAAAAGFRVIIATARWRQLAERVAAEIGISGPIIACSGAQVYIPSTRQDIFDHRLPTDFVDKLYQLCDAHRCIATATYDDHTLLCMDGQPDSKFLSPEMQWTPTLTGTTGLPRIATLQGTAAVAEVKETLKQQYSDTVNIHDSIGPSGKLVLTMTARAADKGEALKAACAHEGIETQAVVAFGDAENDIAMFRLAGASVAMGQASADVKLAATTTTLPNTENGVGVAIEKLLAQGAP